MVLMRDEEIVRLRVNPQYVNVMIVLCSLMGSGSLRHHSSLDTPRLLN